MKELKELLINEDDIEQMSAEQVEVLMKYIQNSNKPGLEVTFLNR